MSFTSSYPPPLPLHLLHYKALVSPAPHLWIPLPICGIPPQIRLQLSYIHLLVPLHFPLWIRPQIFFNILSPPQLLLYLHDYQTAVILFLVCESILKYSSNFLLSTSSSFSSPLLASFSKSCSSFVDSFSNPPPTSSYLLPLSFHLLY